MKRLGNGRRKGLNEEELDAGMSMSFLPLPRIKRTLSVFAAVLGGGEGRLEWGGTFLS